MKYKFPKIKISASERIWLKEVYYLFKKSEKINVRALKVKLLGKLEKNFNPKNIDPRLLQGDKEITLLGIFHIDPKTDFIEKSDKVINAIRNLVISNQSINRIKAEEASKLTNLSIIETMQILKLISGVSNFFRSSEHNDKGGCSAVSVYDDSIDEILHYEGIEKLIKQFYEKYKKTEFNSFKSPIKRKISKEAENRRVWDDIASDKDFGMTKKIFEKRINFIKNQFKRDIIFRDIEQTYVLYKTGFYKPAVVLSGSVMEEILRLYLESKNIQLTGDKFECYIKICKENRFLKTGINFLIDASRHFRNSIHMKKEKNEKDSISVEIAGVAVRAIFILVKNL